MPKPPPPHTHINGYDTRMHEKADTWWGPNQPSPQRTRCYADALTTIPRCPWPPSDRFIVCLERTCSVFTTALGAELEWRHVTPGQDPGHMCRPCQLVSIHPCQHQPLCADKGRCRRQAGRPAGWPINRADHPRMTMTHATAHSRSGVPPLPPLPSFWRTEVSFGSRR